MPCILIGLPSIMGYGYVLNVGWFRKAILIFVSYHPSTWCKVPGCRAYIYVVLFGVTCTSIYTYIWKYIHSYIIFMHLHMFAHAMFWLTLSFHTKTTDFSPSKVHGSDTTGGSLQYLQPNSRCRSKLLGEDHLRSAKMHRKSVHIYIYIYLHIYVHIYKYMCIHAFCMYTYIYV